MPRPTHRTARTTAPGAALRTILLGGAALGLAACVSILPKGEDLEARLGLDAGYREAVDAAPLGVTLSIADPRAEDVFDTPSVAVKTAPLQYEYLAGAEWTDRAPLLLELFLDRRLGATGAFTAVGDRVGLPIADYTLHTDIRALNVDLTDGRAAEIAYGARLTNARSETIATRTFRVSVPMTDRSNGAVALALNEAAARIVDQTFDWMRPIIAEAERADEARDAERAARRARG